MKKQNCINIGYFTGDHSGHCGYCDSQNSYSLGFDTKCLTPDVYQDMMDRGWRRCGTYYYKPNIQLSCCSSFTIRLSVDNYQTQRHSHKKIAKKFKKFLDQDMQNQSINQLLDNRDAKGKLQQKEIKVQGQMQQQPKQIQIQKEKIALSNEGEQNLRNLFSKLIGAIQEDQHNLISLFSNFFQEQGIAIEEAISVFLIDEEISKQAKIFTSKISAKGDYYTNLLMLIYGRQRKLLFQKLSNDKFAQLTQEYFNRVLNKLSDEYFFNCEPTGFLSIFEKQNKKPVFIRQMIFCKFEKHYQQTQIEFSKIHKGQQIELENILPEKSKELLSHFFLRTLEIDNPRNVLSKYIQNRKHESHFKKGSFDTFTFLQIQASVEDQAFEVYKKYCSVIHNKNEKSKSAYQSFLCEDALKANIIKSQIDNTKLLFIGCYHMCYFIGEQLIGIGVVDITEHALSSVYFFYDPKFEVLNFGTFAALVEIEYVQILKQWFPEFKQKSSLISYNIDIITWGSISNLLQRWSIRAITSRLNYYVPKLILG